ncbi:ribosome silencing factor [Thermoproteota archaeon]
MVVLDLRKQANFCDYFVICNGASERQVIGIADGIEEGLLQKKIRCANTNKKSRNGLWSLLDYGDIIIHVFNKDVREYYNLERLWIDAPRISIPTH